MNKGFTLIELLIAVAITSMALGFVTYFAVDVSNFGLDINNRLENERELEMTFRTMISEIRSMGPAANGAYDIATANATAFQFYTDTDGDGQFEQVRYFLTGTTLQKGITKPVGSPATYPAGNETITDVVHHIVPGAIFTYYPTGFPSETGPLASPVDISKIRLITITGTTDVDTTKPPAPTTLSITVTIRNLRGDI
jgi:prepilin-type N-terminal cleavage/methylation domain-containing protein